MGNNTRQSQHQRTVARLSHRLLCGASFLAGVAALGAGSIAQAEDRHWDANGTDLGTGGTGTWTLDDLTWSPSDDGVSGPYDRPWDNTALDSAIFGGAGNAARTVTLGTQITVNNLTFNAPNYTLTGSTLTLAGATPTILTSGDVMIQSVLAGTQGLTKTGAGTLRLHGANLFSGDIWLNGGGLHAANNGALGALSNTIRTGAGATVTLRIDGAGTDRTIAIGDGGTLNISGAAIGSALITGNGNVSVVPARAQDDYVVRLTNDDNDYTGITTFRGCSGICTAYFSSIGNLGEKSSLGAPTTVANGTIYFAQVNNYTDNIVYIGDGDSSDRNWRFSGTGAILRNEGSGALTLTGDILGGGSTQFNAVTADINLLGVLSGQAYVFSGSDGHAITLGNANSFTGTTSIGGTVRAGTLANIGASSSLGAGSTIAINTGELVYTGAGGSSDRIWTANGPAAISNNGTGALALNGSLSFLTGNPSPDSLTLGGNFAGESTFSGVISGVGNLTGNGTTTWILSGANTFAGSVTVNSGTLRAGHASAFGAPTGLIVHGGTLDLGGHDLTAPSLTGTGGAVALGTATLTVNITSSQTYAGAITGTGGLRKAGAGTLTLTGASTYTGATTIGGGRFVLDFSSAGGPTNNLVSGSSPLVLSGGVFDVLGASGENNTQGFGGLSVTAGSNTVRATSGAGGTINLNLGAISRTGGLVNFALPISGTISTTNTDGLLGGWATVNGADYAKVVGGNILAFDETDYTDKDNAGTWLSGEIISDTANAVNSPFFGTVGSDVQLGGLRYTAAASSTVTIGSGNTLGIDGTIIVAPGTLAFDQAINGGSLTGGAGGGSLGVQHNGTGTMTIGSTIVDNGGAVSLVKGGAGTLSLTGPNSYTGGTQVTAGVLRVTSIGNGGAASSIGASSAASANLVLEAGTLRYAGATGTTDRGFTLVNGGPERTIEVVGSSINLTFTGEVTSPDDAGFTKLNSGTLTLANAANTYRGVTTVGGGTLAVSTLTDGGLASSIGLASSDPANIVLAGGTLDYLGATASSNRGITIGAGNGGIGVANAGAVLTLTGTITSSGSGGLRKEGAGTLRLSGTNSYAGATVVNAGTLIAGSARAFGAGTAAMTVNSGATLDLGGFNIAASLVSGEGTINLGARTLTTAGGSGTFTGTITGTGGFTRGAGSFTQTLSGCNNTYTGVTTVSGLLSIDCIADGGAASGIGASGAASANLVFSGGTLGYTGSSASTNRGFALTGNGTLNVTNAATTLEFRGVITGSGALFKNGAGTLVLSGANTYTGATRITEGTLRAGSTQAFGAARPMLLNNTAGVVLDLNGYDTSVSYLELGGPAGGDINLNGATLTITTGNTSATSYFQGAIHGAGNLIKDGPNTQKLTGCNSTYSGVTTINGGILQVDCLTDGGLASSMGTSSAAASNLVLNGGTLRYGGIGGSTNRQFTLGAAGNKLDALGTGAIHFTSTAPLTFSSPNTAQTLTLTGTNTGNNILAAQITNNGPGLTSLAKSGEGTWILTNPGSTYTGVTTISGGVLGVDKLSNGGVASSLGASSAAAENLVIGNGSTLRYTGTGDTTDRLFTLAAGVSYIESSGAGAVVFTDTGPVTLQDINQARVIALGGTNTDNNTLAGSIGDAGTGVTTLAKNGLGTWVLTGNHSFSGSTNVNGGLLSIGGGGTTGSIASATINNFGALAFNRSDSLTYAGAVVGTGVVQQNGLGTTILTGTNSYSGGTAINAGTLQLGSGGTLGSITGDVVNDGVLAFNRSNLYTFGGGISGSGSVTQDGTGTTVLTATNAYTGGTAITAGTLQISRDVNLGAASGPLSITDATLQTTATVTTARDVSLGGSATLLTDAGTSLAISGIVDGIGRLIKAGAGQLILTGVNTYEGGTTISAGTLRLGNGTNTGSIAGDVLNNGALVFHRANSLAFGGLISGSGSLTQFGSGVTILTGANSYTGATTVEHGTLLINGDQSAATGLLTVNGGATLGGVGTIGGDVVVDDFGILSPGQSPGTLTILGDLSLSGASILNFEFGEAGVAGGALNDLIDVGGDLVLDGTINVTETAGGTFGGGVYRVFNYAGGLSDNGLALGTMPAGSDVTVQTSIEGQVNLVNSAGLSLSFWDGDGGPKFNDAVNGGNGIWHLGGADNNWTGADGSVNAAYADGTFAIFGGAGGTVTVDSAGGAVTASGLQFASNGYLVNGDELTLVGPASTLRVGDGTALGADFTATLAADLVGAAQLVKTDLGTLVLSGTNSYSGGTAINGGTLRIADNGHLGEVGTGISFNGGTLNTTATLTAGRSVTLEGAGTLLTNAGTTLTLSGLIDGAGSLTKSGTGSLLLTADNTYTGGTTITGGTLQVGLGGTTGSVVGNILNNAALVFNRADTLTYAAAISGTGDLTQDGPGATTFTGISSYTGATVVDAGTLLLQSGGQINNTSSFQVGSTGTAGMVIDGPGSQLIAGGNSYVGRSGTGTLTIQNGGLVSFGLMVAAANAGSTGTINVIGTGSRLVNTGNSPLNAVGFNGLATLNIRDGGTMASTGAGGIRVGFASGAVLGEGVVDISGSGSRWDVTGALDAYNGALTVAGGGVLTAASSRFAISNNTSMDLLVTGAGSLFESSGALTLASHAGGAGTITIAEGGVVRVGSGTLAMGPGQAALQIGSVGGVPATARAGTLDANAVTFAAATNRIEFNHVDADYVFAAAISGAGSVNHTGSGTTALTADNSYTGATQINAGMLLVNGDQSGATGLTTVSSGATLGGAGIIGGDVTVADGATINPGDLGDAPGALSIAGDLDLAASATLDYNFGQANVVGGPLNDLIEVGGDLVLDGALNVQTTGGGSFDAGVYRVISYGGLLTNNGLAIGTMPGGTDFFVQTSVANQVNLINTNGLSLRFWDGNTGTRNDGVIEGGSGVWQNASGGIDNWTEDTGTANAPFLDAAFAVFMGAPGTVTVDRGEGDINASGLQFLTDGYVIEGHALNLVGSQAVIRVGDGTAAGAGISATIASELTGTAQLIKSDLGTLRLSGANSYTGGTAINGGVLQIASDANLGSAAGALSFNDGGTLATLADVTTARAIDLAGDGSFLTDPGTTLTLNGVISGAGGFAKAGTGSLVLTAANSHAGATTVAAGSLFVNGDQSGATGLTSVLAGAGLGGTGTIGGDVTLADGATLAAGMNSVGTLGIDGNLALAAGTVLNFEFGEANVAGGTLNDLVNVGGDLVLDGTINVTVPAGGSFGSGIYRVFNYGGTLIDNGLDLGSIPVGGVAVQTAIEGQVNLVNASGLTLSFWDGLAGPKNNGAVNGGDGIWRLGGSSDNWTDMSGAVNADYAQASFAVFSAAAGTVTIDNSDGDVLALGMQFANDGYTVAGDSLTLTGADAVIRVGDGSAASADYTAAIDAVLAGSARVVKTDAGTLVLTGANTYTGGTEINGGTLQIASDISLGAAGGALRLSGGTLHTTADMTSTRSVDLVHSSALRTEGITALTLEGAVTGTGRLTKLGEGTLLLAGAGSHTGGMDVIAGTVWVNGDFGGATGAINVAAGAALGGTGTIGGNVAIADGATLAPGAGGAGTLVIGGDLELLAGSTLAFEFGEANAEGGTLNDLVTVGGDLTLDGTINVSVSAGGAFGTGVYRVFNYAGALTDNGLSLGSAPASDVTVQKSIAGQVNLVNSAGLALNFWDGTAGPKNNGAINGGDGTWQHGTGNDNWTDEAGTVNAAYVDSGFAVFGGTRGAVTVDGSLGDVSSAGMQFATDGYTIGGDAITLSQAATTIRVGDGSTAGAGYSATIGSELSGNSQLVKTDAGTLILTGANSYAGGTAINDGTVQIASDANLGAAAGALTLNGGTLATRADLSSARAFVFEGQGTLATAADTTFTYNGLLSGSGPLTKQGTGTLLLTGDNGGYTGVTSALAGTLGVEGTLGSLVDVAQAGRLEGTGRVGGITNSGVVAPGLGGIGTLTVAGDYAGNGGTLEIEAVLGTDSSAADRLVVNGATSGNTLVSVINRDGLGGQTAEGIRIIDVIGASDGTFALSGDYVFNGEQAIIAGAYGYRLYQGGTATPTDGDWYLRSSLLNPVEPEVPNAPLYQPGVPVYEAYGANLQALNGLPTLQQRVGNRSWAPGSDPEGSGIWGRVEGTRTRAAAAVSTSFADQDIDSWKLQLGADGVLAETGQGERLVAGVTAYYGGSDSEVRSAFGNGTLKTDGYGFGATLTWYGDHGVYLDGQMQVSWYRSDLDSDLLRKLTGGNEGRGEAFSFEAGKRAPLGGKLSLTPQIQMVYSGIRFDSFVDPAGAMVAADKGASLKSRWGVSLDHRNEWAGGRSHVYGLANLSYEWLDGTRTRVSGTPIDYADERLWAEVGLGASVGWKDGVALFGEVSGNSPIHDFGDSYSVKGNAGIRIAF